MPRMGDLAATDVYNAFDVPLDQTYDRRLDQTWPGQLVQDAMGAVLAPGRALQSTEPITTEQMIKPAMDLAGLVTGGSYAAPAQRGASGAGIRAYHSSPHDFDRFDLSKIGTGEGAQVYGHGLYFAENPAVSGQGGEYWQQFLPRFEGEERQAAENLLKRGFDREATAKELEEGISGLLKNSNTEIYKPIIDKWQRQIDALREGKPVGPRTYEVNINADPAHMLDWDKPLREQSPLHEGLQDIFKRKEILQHPSGQSLYDTLLSEYSPSTTSAMLGDVGIPGIKYLDQGSRIPDATLQSLVDNAKATLFIAERTKDPALIAQHQANVARLEAKRDTAKSSNYVVFDPGIIDIMKKYGIAGAAPLAMGALAAQDQYRE